jgi:hypothetical protein
MPVTQTSFELLIAAGFVKRGGCAGFTIMSSMHHIHVIRIDTSLCCQCAYLNARSFSHVYLKKLEAVVIR